MINNKSKLCISISSSPSSLGSFVHNYLYKKLNLNYVYFPIKISSKNSLRNIIKYIKDFNIVGCSVSMPHKKNILTFLDKIERTAKKIGSVNTILYKNKNLIGYNTDYFAVKEILDKLNFKNRSILILGNGGMANVFKYYFKQKKILAYVINRKISKKTKYLNYVKYSSHKIFKEKNKIIINCTPIGMSHIKKKYPFELKFLYKTDYVIDCVAKPSITPLIKYCKKKKIKFIRGIEISYYQSIRQFRIYTDYKYKINIRQKYFSYCEKVN